MSDDDDSSEPYDGTGSESDDDDDFDADIHVNYPRCYRSENDDDSDEEDGTEFLSVDLMTDDDSDEDRHFEYPTSLKSWSKPVAAKFCSMEIGGFIRASDELVGRLVQLLKGDSQSVRRWKQIHITDPFDEESNQYTKIVSGRDRSVLVVIIGLAMKCASNLTIHLYSVDRKIFRAFRGLEQATSLEEFSLRLKPSKLSNIRKKESESFADGLAMSGSLKSLSLLATPELGEDASNSSTEFLSTVFDGLKRNNSQKQQSQQEKVRRLLRSDDVSFCKAEADGKGRRVIENLTLSVEMSEQSLVHFGEYLDDADCKLKTLNLHNSSFSPFPPEFQRAKSESLTWLALYSCELSSQRLTTFCAVFPCLCELRLDTNSITDLSPLDPLLLGDSASLQRLSISRNKVGEEKWMEFAAKLPQMKTLRSFECGGNPFIESATAIEFFLDTIAKNRSLSSVNMGYEKSEVKVDLKKVIAAWHCMNVNDGGRRGIQVESAKRPIPIVLWPAILSRCLTRK